MAGRKKKLTPEKVREALKKSHGLKTGAAEILDVAYNTIDRYIAEDKGSQEVIEHFRNRRMDRAEYKLDDAIERGESWAIALVLKDSRMGRSRGYGNMVEHSGPEGGAIPVEIHDVEKIRNKRWKAIAPALREMNAASKPETTPKP